MYAYEYKSANWNPLLSSIILETEKCRARSGHESALAMGRHGDNLLGFLNKVFSLMSLIKMQGYGARTAAMRY